MFIVWHKLSTKPNLYISDAHLVDHLIQLFEIHFSHK